MMGAGPPPQTTLPSHTCKTPPSRAARVGAAAATASGPPTAVPMPPPKALPRLGQFLDLAGCILSPLTPLPLPIRPPISPPPTHTARRHHGHDDSQCARRGRAVPDRAVSIRLSTSRTLLGHLLCPTLPPTAPGASRALCACASAFAGAGDAFSATVGRARGGRDSLRKWPHSVALWSLFSRPFLDVDILQPPRSA